MLSSKAITLLATALSAASASSPALSPRWTYDVCSNDCSLYGVPAPDSGTFNNGPIGGYRGGKTFTLCLGGPTDCSTSTTVSLDFVGLNLIFNFASWGSGVQYQSAGVFLAPMGVGYNPPWSLAPTIVAPNHQCDFSSDGTAVCSVPFTDLAGTSSTDIPTLFGAMCPLTDIEALDFYVAFSGSIISTGVTTAFSQHYPCTSYSGDQCTSYCTTCIYAEMSYRCTKCDIPCATTSITSTTTSSTTSSTWTTSTSTATPSVCDYGTAFGYQDYSHSFTLNSQSPQPQGCNRWGWYETPTEAALKAGISGILYVGAGQNVLSKATNVGTWSAIETNGIVYVTYAVTPPYTIREVQVDLGCLPMSTCAPGQYKFGKTLGTGVTSYTTTPGVPFPSCGTKTPYLIIHAKIGVPSSTTACPPPVAT